MGGAVDAVGPSGSLIVTVDRQVRALTRGGPPQKGYGSAIETDLTVRSDLGRPAELVRESGGDLTGRGEVTSRGA